MNARMHSDVQAVLAALEKVKQTAPGEWLACCPAHADNTPSLSIKSAGSGKVLLNCFAKCEYRDIARALEARGVNLGGRDDRIDPPLEHFQLGAYSSHWDYVDSRGRLVLRVCRWEQPAGRKEIRPLIRTPDGWAWKHLANPRPLFQLNRLAADDELPVIVVEGEKTAAAAQKLLPGFIVTTWPGGADSTGKADWSVLKGRHVYLVPDCDSAGRKAMQWVRQNIGSAARSVQIVDPAEKLAGLPDGWDLADALPAGVDLAAWFPPAVASGRIKRLGELLANPSKPRWLIKNVLEQSVIALLTGARGTYKSFIALHWAMTIAVEGSPVLIISGEGAGIDRRIKAWLKVHAPMLEPETIPVYVIEQRVNLNSLPDVATLCEEIDALGIEPVLSVVDTLSKNSGALDEDSNSEAKVFIGSIDEHLRRRYSSAVVIVHHTGHGEGKRARGASALEADTDASYLIERLALSKTVTVSRERFKDSAEQPKLSYDAKVVDLGYTDEDGAPVTSLVLMPSCAESQEAERKPGAPRGLQQRKILKELNRLQAECDKAQEAAGTVATPLVWTPQDLRHIARDLGLKKQTAQDSVSALSAFYLAPSVGGYRLKSRGES